MKTRRVYIDAPLQPGRSVAVSAETERYLVKVLRLRSGGKLLAFNGDGKNYHAVLALNKRDTTVLEIVESKPNFSESPLNIRLIQCISRGERMDFTLQKSVELGVSEIQVIASARSVVKLDEKRINNKFRHWQRIVISASEQCGRSRVPKIEAVATLEDWLSAECTKIDSDNSGYILLDPRGEIPISDIQFVEDSYTLIVGPEGGFEPNEIELCRAAGICTVSIGPRILRTETAAAAAIAVLQSNFGDLKAKTNS